MMTRLVKLWLTAALTASATALEEQCSGGGAALDKDVCSEDSERVSLHLLQRKLGQTALGGAENDQAPSGASRESARKGYSVYDAGKRALAALWGPKSSPSCPPDVRRCIADATFAAKCPAVCEDFLALFDAMRSTNQSTVNRVLVSFTERAAKALGADLSNRTESLETQLVTAPCNCPSVSCFVGFPLTLLEALIFHCSILNLSSTEPTKQMFDTLAQKAETIVGLPSAETWYQNTIMMKGLEGGFPVDLGLANTYLGNIIAFWPGPFGGGGIMKYRRVPSTKSGGLDFDFSVDQLPAQPEGRPLVVGLVSDWGCGNLAARRVLEELKKQRPDLVIHLGDVYYSGTKDEQIQYFLNLAREILGDTPILTMPGNHDYYSGGSGFLHVIDELAATQAKRGQPTQQGTFFAVRGEHWQLIGLDTGILDSYSVNEFQGMIAVDESWKRANRMTMPFLPDDQIQWALEQIRVGKEKGLKTIMMSHHQLFSRKVSLGYANAEKAEESYNLSVAAGVYEASHFSKTSVDLPGQLPPDAQPAANTRLLDQFPPEVLGELSAWFWGHEHGMSVFEPYAGLQKGRLIGNACVRMPKAPVFDQYSTEDSADTTPWGGKHPGIVSDTKLGQGALFWNLGFATLSLDGARGTARYFQLEDYLKDGQSHWKDATLLHEETL